MILENQLCPSKKSQYHIHLEEKKLRYYYGLTEQKLLKYVRIARKAKGSTGQIYQDIFIYGLDNILFRLGMASNIPQACQLVNYIHILVNCCIVTSIKLSLQIIAKTFASSPFQYKGLENQIIDSKWVALKINKLLVVDYYSRHI
ncbi:hypothetical protein UlMin_001187 [Ulmus minor]